MPQRVLLHVGAMKTGTSFVQAALMDQRAALRAEGVRFLGKRFQAQSRAVRAMLGSQGVVNPGPWHELAAEAREMKQHTAVVSMEFLSFATAERARALLEPFAGFDVTVVLTVRDQLSTVPAQWQTFTRNRGTDGWERYLRNIRATGLRVPRNRARRTFHRAQDLARIVDVWAPLGDLVVVTVPDSSAPREELWHRFLRAGGLPQVPLDAGGVRANESLGYASCEVLRQLNPHLTSLTPSQYRQVVRPLCRDALAPLRSSESRPVLDRATARWADERNQRFAEVLGRFRVEGDLAELLGDDDPDLHDRRTAPAPQTEVDTALAALWSWSGAEGSAPEDTEELLSGAGRAITARGEVLQTPSVGVPEESDE